MINKSSIPRNIKRKKEKKERKHFSLYCGILIFMKRHIADVTYSSGIVQLRGNNVDDVMIAFCRDSSTSPMEKHYIVYMFEPHIDQA